MVSYKKVGQRDLLIVKSRSERQNGMGRKGGMSCSYRLLHQTKNVILNLGIRRMNLLVSFHSDSILVTTGHSHKDVSPSQCCVMRNMSVLIGSGFSHTIIVLIHLDSHIIELPYCIISIL